MKKLFRYLVGGIAVVMAAGTFAACGEEGETSGITPVVEEGSMKDVYGDWTDKELTFAVLDKGAGSDWARDAARNFNAGTGSKITVKADETLNEALSTYIDARSGSDMYYTFSSQSQWVGWALQDKIYDLDDLGLNFRDDMEVVGVINGKRYLMPYNYAPTGFVYNQEYVDEIPSNGEFTTGQFPETWQGLIDMCESVNDKWNKQALGQKVVPLSWGGSVGDMGYIFHGLWAQLDPTGYYDYWNQTTEKIVAQNNKSLFVNENSVKAMDCIISLLAPEKNASGKYFPSNSFSDSISHSNIQAEQKFLNGLSVFTISGSWFENEMKEQIEEEEIDFYRFAAAPKVNADATPTLYINSPAEYIMIAKNGRSNNPDLAKAFLRYLATEERCRVFQAYTGIPAALKYNMQPDTLSRFNREIAEVLGASRCVVGASDQKASLSGAIGFNNAEPYKKAATSEHTSSLAQNIMEELYTKQCTEWDDHFKAFD